MPLNVSDNLTLGVRLASCHNGSQHTQSLDLRLIPVSGLTAWLSTRIIVYRHGDGTKGNETMYVIRRTDQGRGYVARPGSRHSYTRSLSKARFFPTREEADGNRCSNNEVVVSVESELS